MLYLVATPIGNLGDITLRALETLRMVDVVASEDTRKTGLLLKHFDIKKPQIAFHEHNEHYAAEKILDFLAQDRAVALVTNAGTPGISDPGYTIVTRAIEHGYPMTLIPGASAHVMALVLSGLPVHAFCFRGFAPRTPVKRRKFIAVDKHSPHTLIFYESPHRVKAFLQDALAVLGDRHAAVANDLTKKFETIERGTLSALIARLESQRMRGEYCIVIAGLSEDERRRLAALEDAELADEADEDDDDETNQMEDAPEPDAPEPDESEPDDE